MDNRWSADNGPGTGGERLNRHARPNWGHSDYDLTPGIEARRSTAAGGRRAGAYPDRPEGATVLLTRRTAHLNSHAGQISFPGGRTEPEDPSPEDTALREAEEEVGIPPGKVEVIGKLDIYRTVTNYAVTPVVGIVDPGFEMRPDPYEVAEVFETPLGFLMDSTNHHRHTGWFNGIARRWWAMPYGEYYIWGATAGMLMNLHERLSD